MNFSDLEQTVNRIAYFFKLNVKLINLDDPTHRKIMSDKNLSETRYIGSSHSKKQPNIEKTEYISETMCRSEDCVPITEYTPPDSIRETPDPGPQKHIGEHFDKHDTGYETDDDVDELFRFEEPKYKSSIRDGRFKNPKRPGIYKEKKQKIQEELDFLNKEHNKLGGIMSELHSEMEVQHEHERLQSLSEKKEFQEFSEEYSNIKSNVKKEDFSIDKYKREAESIMNEY